VAQVEPFRSSQRHFDVLNLLRRHKLLHLLKLGKVSALDMLDLAGAESGCSGLGVLGQEGGDVGDVQLEESVSTSEHGFLVAIEHTLKISRGGDSISSKP
jgi:hypothetical protein